MVRDIILVLTGGVMQGVFGGGVVTAFQEADLYPRIYSVYASSAGAHNGAYFLSRQTRLGSSIYFDDLSGSRFIRKDRYFRFLCALFIKFFIRRYRVSPIANIGYLIDTVEKKIKRLDVEEIKSQPIDFYVRAFDIKKRSWKYLNGKEDTFQALKASSSAAPYYPRSVEYKGKQYIDGSVIRSSGLLDVARDNPDKLVLYVRNRTRSYLNMLMEFPIICFTSLYFIPLFGWRVALKRIRSVFKFPTTEEVCRYPNIRLIENKKGSDTNETRRSGLISLYHHGIEQGEHILRTLDPT